MSLIVNNSIFDEKMIFGYKKLINHPKVDKIFSLEVRKDGKTYRCWFQIVADCGEKNEAKQERKASS